MGSRLELHDELLTLCPNAYFQPPSSMKLVYPCIVYNKSDKTRFYGSNVLHVVKQGYNVTVIDTDPDSEIANQVEAKFEYCRITQYYVVDNLNHTTLSLSY